MSGRVRVEKEGDLGWIVFDHPERRNAISVDMWRAIPDAASELQEDDAVRVIVMRGDGETAFVAGADISEFERERTPDSATGYDQQSGAALAALMGLTKPLLAMIHGFCIGGGVTIALTADVRYAADDARVGVPAASGWAMPAPGSSAWSAWWGRRRPRRSSSPPTASPPTRPATWG